MHLCTRPSRLIGSGTRATKLSLVLELVFESRRFFSAEDAIAVFEHFRPELCYTHKV